MTGMLKIGYISLFFPPVGGGAELYLGRLIRALKGVEHHVWTTTPLEAIAKEGYDDNCTIRSYSSSPTLDYSVLEAWFQRHQSSLFREIENWADSLDCDLLILNSPIIYFDQIAPLVTKLRRNRPVGTFMHDVPGEAFTGVLEAFHETGDWDDAFDRYRSRSRMFENTLSSKLPGSSERLESDFTIYNSEWVRRFYDVDGVRENYILHPLVERTGHLPNAGLAPVDLTIVNPIPMKGAALFLALANFYFRNNTIRILAGGYNSAMEKLAPFLSPVQSGFFNADLPSNIEVLGYTRNMSEVYRNTKVLLHPTRIEGYGMTAVEALLEDCVVITTAMPGVIEGVGDAAVRMPYHATPQDWADRISAVLEGQNPLSAQTARRAAFLESRQEQEVADIEKFLQRMAGWYEHSVDLALPS